MGEIADHLNFSDQSAMTNFFKQRSGMTPLAYRNRYSFPIVFMMSRRSVFRSLNHLPRYVISWKNRDLKQKEAIVTFQHPLRQ
jgi:AraC-like DNA-binding protein